ncbi:MAG: hypothetical protein ACRDFX_08030 [Chloroflexota bacterium]
MQSISSSGGSPMPRYEEMQDIVQRLSLRFGQSTVEAERATAPPRPLHPENPYYVRAVEDITALARDAEQVHSSLNAEDLARMRPAEHYDLLKLLTRALAELESCERSLLKLAAYE